MPIPNQELFVDTGTTRLQGEPLTIKTFDTGYGGGLSILFLPYFVMRLKPKLELFV